MPEPIIMDCHQLNLFINSASSLRPWGRGRGRGVSSCSCSRATTASASSRVSRAGARQAARRRPAQARVHCCCCSCGWAALRWTTSCRLRRGRRTSPRGWRRRRWLSVLAGNTPSMEALGHWEPVALQPCLLGPKRPYERLTTRRAAAGHDLLCAERSEELATQCLRAIKAGCATNPACAGQLLAGQVLLLTGSRSTLLAELQYRPTVDALMAHRHTTVEPWLSAAGAACGGGIERAELLGALALARRDGISCGGHGFVLVPGLGASGAVATGGLHLRPDKRDGSEVAAAAAAVAGARLGAVGVFVAVGETVI